MEFDKRKRWIWYIIMTIFAIATMVGAIVLSFDLYQ